ncbi:hypothetical protein LTR12_005093 [Friedmanniomyces endolithicus]|nr:hypothetical protein LTR74_001740 [Friedmanniomyces endolithicus]KAK1820505.1 hypothetical protein LTR12_005093 [Friedmanniomyces endolithicus]
MAPASRGVLRQQLRYDTRCKTFIYSPLILAKEMQNPKMQRKQSYLRSGPVEDHTPVAAPYMLSTRQYDIEREESEEALGGAAVPVYLEQRGSALEHTAALVPSPRRTATSQHHGVAPATQSLIVGQEAVARYGRPPTHRIDRTHDSWIAARDGRAWPVPAQRTTSPPTTHLPSPTQNQNWPERGNSDNESDRNASRRRRHDETPRQRRSSSPDDSGIREPSTRPEELRRDARRADMLWTIRITTYKAAPDEESRSE